MSHRFRNELQYQLSIANHRLRDKYLQFYDAHPNFEIVCAGTKHHHWWKSGLADHCTEMLLRGLTMMECWREDSWTPGGEPKFLRSDLAIAIFLHDFPKIYRYRLITDEERAAEPNKFLPQQQFTYANPDFLNKVNEESWLLMKLASFNIIPTVDQWSAVIFAEGGYAEANFGYNGRTTLGDRVMAANPLAAFVHALDIYTTNLLGRSLVANPNARAPNYPQYPQP